MKLIEASAKSNHNIKEIFTKLAQNIIEERETKDKEGGASAGRRNESLQLTRGGQTDKKSGCKC